MRYSTTSLSGESRLPGGLCLRRAVRQGTSFALRLLFDANLSPKLVKRLADLFPDSVHVFASGLGRSASDETIWNYAAVNSFAIVTTDADFVAMAERLEPPTQVIRLKNCNYKTARVAELLRQSAIRIAETRSVRPASSDRSNRTLSPA
jgi:predicted nuclease of predicted toxin-antitoxin system